MPLLKIQVSNLNLRMPLLKNSSFKVEPPDAIFSNWHPEVQFRVSFLGLTKSDHKNLDKKNFNFFCNAQIAQSVRRVVRNWSMAGSNLVPGRAGKRNFSLFSDKARYSQINFWLPKPLVTSLCGALGSAVIRPIRSSCEKKSSPVDAPYQRRRKLSRGEMTYSAISG